MNKTCINVVELVKILLENGLTCSGVEITKDGNLGFVFNGFSKSGTATLVSVDGKILCYTRYDTVDEVTCGDDVIHVAFNWWKDYYDREPFEHPNSEMLPHFERLGLVTKKIKVEHVPS
jgi:hypothetical protein